MGPRKRQIDMELLKTLYIDEKKSLVICGEILGCSHYITRSRLLEMGYKIRKSWEWGIGRERTEEEKRKISLGHIGIGEKRININMEELKRLYVDEKKSFKTCAYILNCSVHTISNRLHDLGCRIRDGGEWCIGRKMPEETKIKLVKANIGRKHSEEAKRNMSKAQKGRKHPWMNQWGENNPCWRGGLFLGHADPIIRECYNIVRLAKKRGKIKEQPCMICGLPGEGHHDDYRKPFEIRWLCPKHHKKFHKKHILKDYKYVRI